MEAMRNSWTDDRLDGFSKETYRRFDEVDRRFDDVDRRFVEVDQRFDRVEQRMESGFSEARIETHALRSEMHARFDSLQRTLMQVGGGVIVALLGIVATQI